MEASGPDTAHSLDATQRKGWDGVEWRALGVPRAGVALSTVG
jgi:hypothetical protein